MRIVVTGATGNAGTSVVAALARDPRVEEIVGLARRVPRLAFPRTRWVQADVATSDLSDAFRGADAVIHLAWLIQPSRDERALEAVNVAGSRRVFEAAAEAGVRALVHASSVGAYSAGPSDRAVDESWPTGGTPTSFDARHNAAAERALDDVEAARPDLRVVRLQPTPPGWLDMGMAVPVMSTRRIREELGWAPRRGADAALLELLEGIRDRAGAATPPLDPRAGGPLRTGELLTGVGGRNP